MEYETPSMIALTESTRAKLQTRDHQAWSKAKEKVGVPGYTLPEKIDRKYVIILLKQVLEQIQRHKLNAYEMSFSLTHSLQALLSKLEIDDMQTPTVRFRSTLTHLGGEDEDFLRGFGAHSPNAVETAKKPDEEAKKSNKP